MVGREVLLRVEKEPAKPAEPLLEVEDLHVLDDRGLEKVRGVSFEVRAGEIVGIAGVDGNGQTRADRRDHRACGKPHGGHGRRRRAATSRTRARSDALDAGPRPHPRGPPAARPRARVLDRREHRAARLPQAARLAVRLAVPAPPDRARAAADRGVRRPRRRAADAAPAALSGGNQQKVDPRARDRPRPDGADRRAADARPRRRRDRVRPPAARRGARRGPRDPARLARARGDPLALRPDPRHVRGRDRRRVPADGDRGGARHRDDRRRRERGGSAA